MSDAKQMTSGTEVEPSALEKFLTNRTTLIAFTGVLILVFWEVFVRVLDLEQMARPLRIAEVFPETITSEAFLTAAGSTLGAVFSGLLISIAAGTIFGVAMGRIRVLDKIFTVYVNTFYSMPMIAILPLIVIWFGYDEEARLATIIFAAFFSIVINVSDGARSTPPEFIEVARAYRATQRSIWFGITLLSALPYLLAGVRLAAGRALVGAVIAEFFLAQGSGLGRFIFSNVNSGIFYNEAFIGVIALAAFGVTFDTAMNTGMRVFFPWYRRDTKK